MLKARKKKSETIAGMIRENLLGHPLPAGTPVASSREIARKYKVSLSTADQALNLLVQEDFLYRTKGSGTFLKLDSYARPLRIGVADQIVSSQYLSPEINRILNNNSCNYKTDLNDFYTEPYFPTPESYQGFNRGRNLP